jgi:hypothetical protein
MSRSEARNEAPNRRRATSSRRVALVCQLDGFANGVRPRAIERYLTELGHDVHVVDTFYLSRAAGRGGGVRTKLPGPSPTRLLLYLVEVGRRMSRWGGARRRLSYHLFMAEQRVRRAILASVLRHDDFDLVICETPADVGVLLDASAAITLYDCPTPWADELLFEGLLTPRQHGKLRAWESAVIEQVDFMAFYWESYARYALAHYSLSGHNLITLNYGCNPAPRRAQYRLPLRIAYIGSLSSRFIDLPLLARLSRAYPLIDVYGNPPPDPALGLNYRGYASPAVLQHYQLGLITCTNDELRREGFSAKHLEYISFGLPVLVPTWRRNLDLLKGSVPYDEASFTSVVAELGCEQLWTRISDEAYSQAQRLTWADTLEPLRSILAGPRSRFRHDSGP